MKLIVFFLVSTDLIAAGGSHVGSAFDLKYAALNFVLLFSFLIWKLKKPMSEMFNKQADDVKSLYEMAEKKDKEAQIKLNMYKQKIENLVNEKKKILKEAGDDAALFAKKTGEETISYIERISKDVDSKISHERNVLVKELNANLVDEVIRIAKEAINTNNDYKKKATQKLVSQIK